MRFCKDRRKPIIFSILEVCGHCNIRTWLGALDGVHDAGLAVARTFDGRITHCEDRFQIPLLRYVLECRSTTAEAIETMSRIPVQMANDVMVLGVRGDHAPAGGTPYCWPDRPHWTL